MKKIFFIIPIYNVEKYLGRCVESVLKQTYGNVEIILVDDGSPDKCPELCDQYAQKYNNIKVIHKDNGGLSDARNAGLLYLKDNAQADDYVTFLDSDDYVREDFAEKMFFLCEENNCDVAQCDYEKGDKEHFGKPVSVLKDFFLDTEQALLGYSLKSQSCAKIYKIKTFENVFFPLKMLNEDEFTTYRAIYNGKMMAFTNQKLYYYYQHGTSIMEGIAKKLKNSPHKNDYLKAYHERIEFFKKENKPKQVLKTHEKICTDIILRYCEQMYLKKEDRDEACINGTYKRLYNENFNIMIKRKEIPLKRRLMYIAFYIMPQSAVLMGKIFSLRK